MRFIRFMKYSAIVQYNYRIFEESFHGDVTVFDRADSLCIDCVLRLWFIVVDESRNTGKKKYLN